MAGFRVYSFDWAVFADLTSNPESRVPAALGEALLDQKTRKKLGVPARLPKSSEKLSALIRGLFLAPVWYADGPRADARLRHRLLFAMFFDKALKPIGLGATPSCREFREDCGYNLGYVLAGRATVNLDRTSRSNGLYIKLVGDAEPGENAFWWFGNRPYRHGNWRGTNEEQWDFEEEAESPVYSIQSPDEVEVLARQFDEKAAQYGRIDCEELQEMISDYRYCLDTVRARKAGMLVENES